MAENNLPEQTLLWFRNDLRIDDNPALQSFIQQSPQGKIKQAIFFKSLEQWKKHDWSDIKIDFTLRHVVSLQNTLQQYDIALQVIDVPTYQDQVNYLISLSQKQPLNIFANAELEVNEHERDAKVSHADINLTLFESDVIVPKGQILTKSGEMFKVFTPFKRAWIKWLLQFGCDHSGRPAFSKSSDYSDTEYESDSCSVSYKWPLAKIVQEHIVDEFIFNKVESYKDDRDFPSIKGTSGLSPYLASGLISPKYVFNQLQMAFPDILLEQESQSFAWLNELIWRDFYRHLLHAHPRLCKHQSFNVKYQDKKWNNDTIYFKKWCEGKTGYPLIDAAMRQLNQTGWMHNRLRMVVASFLTKHLLIDWRLGERYFMQNLIDGDLAANNGGWQWAASTGCDAQPYFRVFNPIRQSERFDPDGEFIRKYIPELATIPAKYIHFPHDYMKKNNLTQYWPAIVEHKQARLNAIDFYK